MLAAVTFFGLALVAQRRVAAGYRLNLGLGVAAVVCTAEALMTRTLGPRLLDADTGTLAQGGRWSPLRLTLDQPQVAPRAIVSPAVPRTVDSVNAPASRPAAVPQS